MEIEVREISKDYKEVIITGNNVKIESGTLNREECFDLAKIFQDAIDYLTE